MALESKTAEQKLQKMEDSRRKNEKMAKQVEKVWPEQFIILPKNIITLIQSNLSYLDFFWRYFYYSVWGLAFVVLFVINIYLLHLQSVTTFAINQSTCKEAAIRLTEFVLLSMKRWCLDFLISKHTFDRY